MYMCLKVILSHFMHFTESAKRLPKKLFLQLDDTTIENKNRCVLAFLTLLVQLDIFEEVCYHVHDYLKYDNYLCIKCR